MSWRRRTLTAIAIGLALFAAVSWWTNATSLHRRGQFTLPSGANDFLGMSPDGRTLIASGQKKAFVIADAKTGTLRAQLTLEDLPHAVLFTGDGKRFAYAGWSWLGKPKVLPDGSEVHFESPDVTLRETSDGRVVATLPDTTFAFGGVFSPDGRKLVVESSRINGKLDVVSFDTETWKETARISLPFGSPGFLPSLAPDAKTIAVFEHGNQIAIKDVATGKDVAILRPTNLPPSISYHWHAHSPDGRFLAVSRTDGHVDLWDLSAGQLKATLTGRTNDVRVSAVLFSRDSRFLAVRQTWDSNPRWARRLPFGFDQVFRRPAQEAMRHELTLWDVTTG